MALLTLQKLLDGDGFAEAAGVAARALEKQREVAQTRMENLLVDTLTAGDRQLLALVGDLRRTRKLADKQLEDLKKVSAAYDHLKATGNPLPYYKATGQTFAAREFCREIGVPVPESDDPLWVAKPVASHVEVEKPQ